MTLADIRELVLAADPDACAYESDSIGEDYTTWQPLWPMNLLVDNRYADGWHFVIDRFTRMQDDQITILLNGVNISNPQTGHNASDFPVALADIDHIEVLEGAASRVFGTSAFNGAINIVTKKAKNDGVSANVEGGSFGSFGAQGRVQTAFETGKWTQAYSVSGGYKRSDGGTENSDFEKGQGYGNLSLSYDQRFDIIAQLGIATQSYGANTFYSAKYNNQYEKTDHGMASLKLSLQNQ